MTVVKERKQVLACDPCGKTECRMLKVREVKCHWPYCRYYLHVCGECLDYFAEVGGPYCPNHRARGTVELED